MPRRRDKRTDTENSDDYDDKRNRQKVVHFGTVQFNRMLAPDQIEGDDSSKYSILAWSNTLLAQRLLPWSQRKLLFKRALTFLPYSYKIWHMFLEEFVDFCSNRSLFSKEYTELNQLFEEALAKLPKMPRIWLMYADMLEKQHLISKTRSVYNWSFRNLPLTQHEKIWHKFSLWAMRLDNSATALKVVPRYIQLNPDFKQLFSDYLKEKGLFDQSVIVIQQILADEGYHSKAGKSRKDFYFEMMDLISEHPESITSVKGDEIIRAGLQKYPEESGKCWVKLSDFYIRFGQFDKARDTLEEALNTIDNAKDFGIIFNAYCKFEEEMITALASEEIKKQFEVIETDNVDYQIEVRLKKLQNLLERQPYLLHKINIRKNANNVKAWLGLITLHKKAGHQDDYIAAMEEALNSIKPAEVENGRLSQIYIEYSKMYQEQKNLPKCNNILNRGSSVHYKLFQDYLNIWVRWIECLLEEQYYHDALAVVKHVLFRKKAQDQPEDLKIKNIDELLKSNIVLWQLYIDIESNIGNFESIKTAYERCKEHKCLTPVMLINFTNFIWEHNYFEEAFRVFEFAVGNFKWPSLYEIWISYITKFIQRYGDTPVGVERSRSMFERLMKDVPIENSAIFYFMYAEFQQEYGLYSHAIEIYDRMINAVPKHQKYQAYCIYIAKVAKLLGVTKTRTIFDSAMQKLSEKEVLTMGRQYAKLEKNLGEIERTRSIYTYISQFTDPRDDYDTLWKEWQDLELEVGDKETYKEYLRIKRSVEAKYTMLPPDLQKIEQNVKKGLV